MTEPTPPSPAPRARAARGLFLAYVLVLLLMTHWPRLEIPADEIPRPDLLVHVTAFALWTFLCARAAWFGPAGSARNLALAGLVALAYAAIDESSQAIPFVQRHCSWDDFAANTIGVGAGLALATLVAAIDLPTADHRSHTSRAGR